MNKSKHNVQFSSLTSQSNPIVTWLLRIVFVPIFAAIPILLYALPALFVIESPPLFSSQTNEIIFLIVSYLLLTRLGWFVIQYFKKISSKAVTQIEVDEKGVHFKNFNVTTSTVLYQDLTHSDNPYTKDIHTESLYKGPVLLKVFWRSPETGKIINRSISFDTDIFYGHYTSNKSDLIGRFLLGVRLFRPDLKVCDTVYSNFYIHRETFAFDRKNHRKVMVGSAIFVSIIVYLIYLYTT